jgi:hypothetical protein
MNLRGHRIDNDLQAQFVRSQSVPAGYGYTEHSGSCLFGGYLSHLVSSHGHATGLLTVCTSPQPSKRTTPPIVVYPQRIRNPHH